MQIAYRIVEVKHDHPHTLFHGLNRTRRLPVNEWLQAKSDKPVRDGTGPWYTPGFNVLLDREACEEYLTRFTAPRELVVVEIRVNDDLRPKAHSRSQVMLADLMYLPWPQIGVGVGKFARIPLPPRFGQVRFEEE